MKIYTFILKTIVIAILHCGIGLALYRGRAHNAAPIFQSDFIVFIVPILIAFVLYCLVFWSSFFWQSKPVVRYVVMCCFAVFSAFLSFWFSIVVAFNKYGT